MEAKVTITIETELSKRTITALNASEVQYRTFQPSKSNPEELEEENFELLLKLKRSELGNFYTAVTEDTKIIYQLEVDGPNIGVTVFTCSLCGLWVQGDQLHYHATKYHNIQRIEVKGLAD